ncbi:hypothetical protein NQ314_012398 [Rhamnusium bicolor]|uniref:PiggyBac transposable element-derived protein 4 n=1 Tax=Rhamnusium bicolor TaxID=1586634 RepID=A0AAV8XCZ7_9CUCU|nr:hypothetical protein NQ314_012398 [Rhamnusium bicolor]
MPDLERVLNRGETQYKCSNKLVALKWKDKREVFMLTTMHNSEVSGTGKIDKDTGEEKRNLIAFWSTMNTRGAVDSSDMMLSSTECVRRTVKWYKKVFLYLLDIAIFNSHALYQTSTGNKISLQAFQMKVIDQILENTIPKYIATELEDNLLRLTARPFPLQVPPTEKKMEAQKRCVVCAKMGHREDTRYMCAECNVPLCLINCFERYHTIKNY